MNALDHAPSVLEVRDLTKVYPGRRGNPPVRANEGISLTVRQGEIVAILGPNGAGKSTFLKQVAGQLLPTSGSVRVCGIDAVEQPLQAKRVLSVIPQECTPYDSLTVEEHVRYFGVIKGMEPRTSVEETARLLTSTGLTEHRRKLVRELSGGLKRRVLIALALAGPGNRLLLLDEPTTGLDPESRRSVWKVVEGMAHAGRGILLTTHYIDEAEFLADRIVIIAKGRILAQGTSSEIASHSTAKGRLEVYNADRLSPEGRKELEGIRARWSTTLEREDRLRLAVPDPFSTESMLALSRLTALGVRASLAPASLEDAYLSIAGEAPEP